jgi:tripartite-type tricarboxylate transporter receptor subunit TctC
MPGAGGITAANFTYEKAPKDGTTLLFGQWYLLAEAMQMQGVRVKYDELTVVAPTRSPGSYVTYMRKDAVPGGYKEPKDILKASKLRVAGVAPTSSVDQRLVLSFRALGTDIVHVTGLPGLARAAQSVRTGEMQASGLALAGYMKSVKPNMVDQDGTVTPLFYWALEDDKGNPLPNEYAPKDIPSFHAYYKAVKGSAPSGKYWEALRIVNDIAELATHIYFGPPGMEPAAIEPLRQGVQATLKDPKYIEQATKISTYPHVWVPVNEAEALVQRVKKVDPEVIAVLKEIVAKK